MRLTVHPSASRPGYSLLEVILALAILSGALAALGEVARHTMQNVTVDRVLTRAEMLCESKLAEIVSGLTPPDPAQGTLVDDGQELGDPGWQYTLEVDPIDSQGLVAVRITVQQDLPAERHPVEFSLVRWITTPDALASLSSANNSSSSNAGNASNSSQSPAPASAGSSGTGAGS
ncbi:MAG: prepilin-type N-terminal cleavage/methylation domain-containing protein [Thermoguttaceae bacterium]